MNRLNDLLAWTTGYEQLMRPTGLLDGAQTVPGLPVASGITRLAHPAAGELRLAFETLGLAADDDQRLVVYLAADAVTSDALGRLARPGPRSLGVVS
jgi:hypothetical protein